jgi:hypothetical protein
VGWDPTRRIFSGLAIIGRARFADAQDVKVQRPGSLPLPCWLRLVRAGTTVTGQRSTDGVTWTTVGSATVSLGTTANLGLGVTAHNNALVASSSSDRITFHFPFRSSHRGNRMRAANLR